MAAQAQAETANSTWTDLWTTVRDGIKLYGRHYPAPGSHLRPVVCLAGLTRNSRDFHVIAEALSGTGPGARPVYTLDSRGRGLSEFDSNWRNYTVPIEMMDVQDVMAANHLHHAAILGTSRGGLIAMVLGAAQPSLIGPVILNDIGPVLSMEGLARIAGYVGKIPQPRTWNDAARLVADVSLEHFPDIEPNEWMTVARQWFNERNGRPVPGYDASISKTFSLKDDAIPELWPQFETLKSNPVLVLRGENSDLLSEATVDEMQRRHPRLSRYTVANQGHAPLLHDAPTIAAVGAFLAEYDTDTA